MTTYYILTKPFGIGSRVRVSANNLTAKGAVKKFKALGYNVTEEDVKLEPWVRPCINYNFFIPSFTNEQIEKAKTNSRFGYPENWEAKAWNYASVNQASRDAEKAVKILKAADIDCHMHGTSFDVYKDTNSPEMLEFAKIVVETLRAPKKELN